MRLQSIFPFLLLIASQAAIAAPASSIHPQPSHNSQTSSRGVDTEKTSLLSARARQANDLEEHGKSPTDEHQGFIVHGKDDREKEISLCEAGIVSACRSSIEAAQAESKMLHTTEKVHDENSFNNAPLFPSAKFLIISCAVVCVITIARRSKVISLEVICCFGVLNENLTAMRMTLALLIHGTHEQSGFHTELVFSHHYAASAKHMKPPFTLDALFLAEDAYEAGKCVHLLRSVLFTLFAQGRVLYPALITISSNQEIKATGIFALGKLYIHMIVILLDPIERWFVGYSSSIFQTANL
ncbi:hypothetical protein N7523_007834 [Penicillium sp. IBT 18751x]|nr:hypothetical protein N7523_007834 [Penicillium sp. IBT 18751x]